MLPATDFSVCSSGRSLPIKEKNQASFGRALLREEAAHADQSGRAFRGGCFTPESPIQQFRHNSCKICFFVSQCLTGIYHEVIRISEPAENTGRWQRTL